MPPIRALVGAAALVAAAALASSPALAFSARSLEEVEADLAAAAPAEPARPEVSAQPAAPVADDWAADADLYADEEAFEEEEIPAEPDPFETMNRGLFRFNNQVDRFVLDPASRAYAFVVPDPAEAAILRGFENLNSPVVFVNDVMQLELKRAGVTLTRFLVNSTLGVVGLFDVAADMGLEGHQSDFGQTLARYGLGSGPYIVIPILGPATLRDAVGFGVDLFFRPLFYLLGPFDFLIVGSGNGFVVRASYVEELDILRESSVDYYAAMRSIYFQRRAEQLRRHDDRRRDVAAAPPTPR